jgi:uncharacterized protein (TIGR03435 family)
MMRRRALGAIAIVLIFAGGAQSRAQTPSANESQSFAGTWQGTLHAGQDLRMVFNITNAADGYSAVFHSIDQGLNLSVSRITLDGSTVKMTLAKDLVTYEGKLSADGKTITGTWTQGSNLLPLTLARTSPETSWTIPTPPKLPRMDANASPAFEVATIKPSKPDELNKVFLLGRRRFKVANADLSDLITFAYGVHPKQVIGAPAWAEADKFDIEAEPDGEGVPSIDQYRVMLQKLLGERCQLSFHHDRREMPVYILSVAKAGAKLTPSLGNDIGLPGLGFRGRIGGDVAAFNATIGDFINFMTRNVKLDRPMIDRTGITGRYDFTLDWTPDDSQFGGTGGKLAPPAENLGTLPSLYTAIQEQLGLRLEATKAAADVLVIDRVEKPSNN